MGLDKLFGRKAAKVESTETPSVLAERELSAIVFELDMIFTSPEVDAAFERLFREEVKLTPGDNLSPASNQLIKDLEKLREKYGAEAVQQAIIAAKSKRLAK